MGLAPLKSLSRGALGTISSSAVRCLKWWARQGLNL